MLILSKQNIEDLIFIDIETSYEDPNFGPESPKWEAWKYDFMKQFQGKDHGMSDQELELAITDEYFRRAALYAEYGIITCITIGMVDGNELFVKTFSGEEKQMLEEFHTFLEKATSIKTWLVGHAVTIFDAPFISKKCMMHRVKLHRLFDVAHLKPWEVSYLDTATLWKGTGFKASSFIALCASLGVESPKQDIDGSQAPALFWEGEISRICAYCEKDVIAVAQVVRALRYEEPLKVSEETLTTQVDVLTYLMSGGTYTDEVQEKLYEGLMKLSQTQRAKAFTILNAIPTQKKGMATDIANSDIKKLQERCNKES